MKAIISAILCLCMAASAPAAHVLFNLTDFIETTPQLSRKTLVVEPRSTVFGNGNNVITSEKRFYNVGTNASVTVSNMVYGLYLCSVWGTTRTSIFRIYVPDSTNLTNAAYIIVGSGPGLLQDNGRYIFADP